MGPERWSQADGVNEVTNDATTVDAAKQTPELGDRRRPSAERSPLATAHSTPVEVLGSFTW